MAHIACRAGQRQPSEIDLMAAATGESCADTSQGQMGDGGPAEVAESSYGYTVCVSCSALIAESRRIITWPGETHPDHKRMSDIGRQLQQLYIQLQARSQRACFARAKELSVAGAMVKLKQLVGQQVSISNAFPFTRSRVDVSKTALVLQALKFYLLPPRVAS
eukprot:6175374-Pleurochrysis_carterae.AAC.2